jgi:hypothetical protein
VDSLSHALESYPVLLESIIRTSLPAPDVSGKTGRLNPGIAARLANLKLLTFTAFDFPKTP